MNAGWPQETSTCLPFGWEAEPESVVFFRVVVACGDVHVRASEGSISSCMASNAPPVCRGRRWLPCKLRLL